MLFYCVFLLLVEGVLNWVEDLVWCFFFIVKFCSGVFLWNVIYMVLDMIVEFFGGDEGDGKGNKYNVKNYVI